MNNNITQSSRSLVNPRPNVSNESRRQRSRLKSPDQRVATYTASGASIAGSNVTASINDDSSLERLPRTRRPLHKGQQLQSDSINEKTPAQLENWFDNSSTFSLVSKTSTTDIVELKLQHAAKFAKLLPRNNSSQEAAPNGLRKTLSRKVGIRNLFAAANARQSQYHADCSSQQESADIVIGVNDEFDFSIQTVSTFPSIKAPSPVREVKPQPVILPQNRTKHPVPQGDALEKVQLNLQEAILSQITQQAIEGAHQDNASVKGKQKAESIDSEVEPDELDRELEVTRELMKRVRTALNDGSFVDLSLSHDEGREDSIREKETILCDILLMLRRAFRDICVSFVRPYRPTGAPVRDQEMIEELDAYIIAQKDLHLSHPQMSVQEVLESLDMDKSEAG